MGFKLAARETVSDGIKRMAWEQVDQAIQELGSNELEQSERIHQARKRFKKVRGILRLVRPELGQRYSYENQWFRDAGRGLSGMRDAHVLIETFDTLLTHFDHQLNRAAFAETRTALVARSNTLALSESELDWIIGEMVANLNTALDRIYTWPLSRHGFPAIKAGLHKNYARGYKGFHRAYKSPTVENFHEWRKRGKYLWYHIRILQNVWPDIMIGFRSSLKQLSDYLGNDHDLAVLGNALESSPNEFGTHRNIEVLLGLIKRRQAELQATARPIGMWIYAETPRQFIERMEHYWEAWQTEERQKFLDTASDK